MVHIEYFDTNKAKKAIAGDYKEWVKECTTHIKSCEGDMHVICLILNQQLERYKAMLEELTAIGKRNFNLNYQIERIEKILKDLCTQMNYDLEKAIEKCTKEKVEKANDIGEDAMVMFSKGKKGL